MSKSVRTEASVAAKQGHSSETEIVNYLNIGLILVSFTIALFLPFELFLFAYAVLGPGHYLTEISWLQKRNFFTKGSYDAWFLGALAAVTSFCGMVALGPLKHFGDHVVTGTLIGLAFGSGLVFILVTKTSARIMGLALVAAISLIVVNTNAFTALVVGMFIPTLIHVYVFTGFFIIFGALKARSVSGYVTFACFLLCPLLYLVIHPARLDLVANVQSYWTYIVQSYMNHFGGVNATLLGLAVPNSQAQMDENVRRVFVSPKGLVVMRFIAFAYTYHYLNWYSKTAIIKWHKVSVRRLSLVGTLWAACIGLYLYDYILAVKVLACLSLLHVFLEFPLNHVSILGVFRELPVVRMRPVILSKKLS